MQSPRPTPSNLNELRAILSPRIFLPPSYCLSRVLCFMLLTGYIPPQLRLELCWLVWRMFFTSLCWTAKTFLLIYLIYFPLTYHLFFCIRQCLLWLIVSSLLWTLSAWNGISLSTYSLWGPRPLLQVVFCDPQRSPLGHRPCGYF